MATFSGTSAVTNGSATVVFTGPTLSPLAVFPGAQVSLGGYFAVIASITNTTTFVLTSPFTGTTNTSVPTTINTISENEADIVTLNTRTADLIEDLLEFDPLNNLASISPLTGTGVVFQDATGAHSIVPKGDFIQGVQTDGEANTIAERNTLYGSQVAGFSVLVANVGDGRSAVYFKQSNTLNDWSTPAYLTGPASTVPGPVGVNWRNDYSVGTAYVLNDGVTFNGSSFRKLNSSAAGNAPSSAIPPVNNANWEVLAARGVNGSISGVTTFWNDRITVDTTAAQAQTGLGLVKQTGVLDSTPGSLQIVGAFGNGLRLDLRSTVFETGTPADIVNRGQVSGLASSTALGLPSDVPALAELTISSHWTDGSALPVYYRRATSSGRVFIQNATSISTWGTWFEIFNSGNLPVGIRNAVGGTANALTITASLSLVTGRSIRFRASSANTGAATIAYAGGAAVACRTITGAVLPAGYIRTDVDTFAVYDGTNWVLDRAVERGSNANGTFTRYADGSQKTLSIDRTVNFISATLLGATLTLPATFVDTNFVPVLVGTSRAGAYSGVSADTVRSLLYINPTTTTVDMRVACSGASSGATITDIRVLTEGWWY